VVAVAVIVGACGGAEDESSPAVTTPASPTPTLTAVPSPLAAGSYALTLDHGGDARSYLLHVPESYDPSAQPALVLAFHSRPSTPRVMELLSGLSEKADQEGFLVAYPEGIRGRSFNTETDSPDDVGFTGALIDEITMTWGTDPDRVYATGMSNGAEMVYRLAAEMGGRLAAIAPVSGAPTDPGQIGPATPMSLVTFTGTADGAVAIPAAEGLETWRERAGCSAPTVRTHDDGHGTVEIATSACADGTEVVWYSVTGMGHAWPGDARVVASEKAPVIAADVIWDFFERHPRTGGDP
jgi:polyhydroxybutyrate depolymerase